MTQNLLNQKMPVKSWVSMLTQLGGWRKGMKLNILEQTLNDTYMMCPLISKEEMISLITKKQSVMRECQVKLKNRTSRIRLRYLNTNIPMPKSFLTTDQDSISRERVYNTSWMKQSKEKSKNLWLPTKTDFVVSDLISSSISLKNKAMLKSWFSVQIGSPQNLNYPKTSSLSSLSLVPESTVLENINLKSKKTKFYISSDFKPIMKQIIGAYRYFYNQGVSYLSSLERGFFIPDKNSKKKAEYIKYENDFLKVETGGVYAYGIIPKYDNKGTQISLTSFQTMRNYLKNKRPDWFDGKLPSHIIDQAAKECASNFKTIINFRKKDRKRFHMSYKSKRTSATETIDMEKSSLNKNGQIYKCKFSGYDTKVYTKEPINFKNNENEYKIVYNRNSFEYHIILLNKVKKENLNNKNKWCSIDPGEKIFMTIYNPFDREVIFAGCDERDNFNNSTVDKLQKSISLKKNKNRIKALQRAREKDKNHRFELHQKMAHYLCSNFKHIIIPDYGVKNMKIKSSKVNRSMRNLGFNQFLNFLKYKCFEKNVKLYIVNESYTTKACCRCGHLNNPTDREYNCSNCKLHIHRDVNGSVNIGLKHLKLIE